MEGTGDPGERAFLDAVAALTRDAVPSDGDNLDGMTTDVHAYLWMAPEIDGDSVTVRHTVDPRGLVVAECRAASGVSLRDAARAVRRVWGEWLAYSGGAAQRLDYTEEEATLRFATRLDIDDTSLYVTGTVSVLPAEGG